MLDPGMAAAATNTTEAGWAGQNSSSVRVSWPWLGLDWAQLLAWSWGQCRGWQPVHQICYQAAHLCLLAASLAPRCPLAARLGLLCYGLLLAAWAALACSPDSLGWAAAVVAASSGWAGRSLLASCRGSRQVPPQLRSAYTSLFRPLGVSPRQFQRLVSCSQEVRQVAAQETVITEKVSRVDCLTIVLAGRLLVSQAGRALHLVTKDQFLDSPEWFGVTTDEIFQVTVTALEPGTLLTWHRDRVKFCLMEEPRLQAIFEHVVARDVVRKLMQVNSVSEELQLSVTKDDDKGESGDTNSGSGGGEEKDDCDDKKPMIDKDVVKEKSLLGSLIGGELPHWRLVNIKETEDETNV